MKQEWKLSSFDLFTLNELTDMVKFRHPVFGGPVQIINGGIASRIMESGR